MNQTQQILNHLKRGKSITPLQALNRFGCLRLSGRIFELREAGHVIYTTPEKKNGKVYAKYYM